MSDKLTLTFHCPHCPDMRFNSQPLQLAERVSWRLLRLWGEAILGLTQEELNEVYQDALKNSVEQDGKLIWKPPKNRDIYKAAIRNSSKGR